MTKRFTMIDVIIQEAEELGYTVKPCANGGRILSKEVKVNRYQSVTKGLWIMDDNTALELGVDAEAAAVIRHPDDMKQILGI